MKRLMSICVGATCSLLLFGWASVAELELDASHALANPGTLFDQGFSNSLNCAIQSTNQIMKIDANLVQAIAHYQHFLNTADGSFIGDEMQCLSNVVDLTVGMTNSWQFWAGRLLLAGTYASDNDLGTAYQISTNHIRMLHDLEIQQETNVLCNAILAYYEITNTNVEIAFTIYAGMASAGLGMGNEATNFANQVATPYRNMILQFIQ